MGCLAAMVALTACLARQQTLQGYPIFTSLSDDDEESFIYSSRFEYFCC